MRPTILLILCLITAILVWTIQVPSTHGQKVRKCRTNANLDRAPKYRIGRTERGVLDKNPILLLQISVDSTHFNRADMSALAERLRMDFCKETHLSVAICDDYSAAKDGLLLYGFFTHQRPGGLRGFYDLNRLTGKEGLSFSTERGRSVNEVELSFDSKTTTQP